MGKQKGIKIKLDNQGRIILPSCIRKELNFNKNEILYVYLTENGVFITKNV